MPPVVPPSQEDATYTLRLVEDELLRAWRFERYVALGVDLATAAALADARADWHLIDTLVQAGCPPHVAARILL